MAAPAAGCRLTIAHSSALSRPALFRIAGGDLELADVVQVGADAVPDQGVRLHPHAPGDLAGEVGDPVAVPGGGVVLGLDALRPATHHVDEAVVEASQASGRVAVGAAYAELGQGAIGTVEGDQRLGVAVVARQEVGALAGGLGDEQEVVELLRLAVALFEQAFGARVVAEFAGDDAVEREGARGEGDVVEAAGQVEGAFG
jgi:hypothetical protein